MHVCHCWWWCPLERLHLDAIVFTVCTALKANFVPLHQLQPFHSAFTESVCCFESIIAYFIVLCWIIIHSRSRQKVLWLFHRIHRRQHASTDDAGMSKHRLSPYNAYYHNWLTLNFTASDSSSDDRCFLKVLIVLHSMQLAGSKFQLSITLFENAYFLTFSLNLFLNSLWPCPFHHLHLAGKIIQD